MNRSTCTSGRYIAINYCNQAYPDIENQSVKNGKRYITKFAVWANQMSGTKQEKNSTYSS